MGAPPLPPGSWAMKNNIMDLRWNLVWEPEDTPPLKPRYHSGQVLIKERASLLFLLLLFLLSDLFSALWLHASSSTLLAAAAWEAGALFLFWWGLGVGHDTLWRRGLFRLAKREQTVCSVFNLFPCLVFAICSVPALKSALTAAGSHTEKTFWCGFGLCAAFAYLFLCWMVYRGHLFVPLFTPAGRKRNLAVFLLLLTLLVICVVELCWSLFR